MKPEKYKPPFKQRVRQFLTNVRYAVQIFAAILAIALVVFCLFYVKFYFFELAHPGAPWWMMLFQKF